ncbi:MAG: patatin-like phospholipase family protein [Acidimicrobiia bacterium]
MATAFVLTGGASLGAVQVGMLQALAEGGIRPDVLIGASVGAVNAAWLAAAGPEADLDQLASLWPTMRRGTVFPTGLRSGLEGLVGRRAGLVESGPLRRLLERHLPVRRIEDTAVALRIVVADLLDGRDVALRAGPLVGAVLASTAIPGVFPPVDIDGRSYVDGGVVNNAPLSHALEAGADEVYVLPCGYACALEVAPRSALAVSLQALTLLVNRRLASDIDRYREACRLHVLPPPCPNRVAPFDFSHADELIAAGLAGARAYLRSPGGVGAARLLVAHEHPGRFGRRHPG